MIITVPDTLYTLSVSSQQLDPGNTNLSSVGFRNLIENHIPYILGLVTTGPVSLDPKKESIFTGDFYNLLRFTQNIMPDMYFITMRLNGLYSPTDYSGNLGQIYLANRSDIISLLNRYLNSTTTT
jgi:hypothetical protein